MWHFAVLIIVALAMAMPVQAKSDKQKTQGTSHEVNRAQNKVERQEAFSPAERNLIRSQILGHKPAASKQGYNELPPGLQKKVARGKALPPGWQKKVTPGHNLDYQVYRNGESLPDVLLRRLPPSPVGSEIIQIENKIVRLNSATRTILDVFDLTPAH